MNNYKEFSKSRFNREVHENAKRIKNEIYQYDEQPSVSQSVDIPNQDLSLVESKEDNEELHTESEEYEVSSDEDDKSEEPTDFFKMFPLVNETQLQCFENNLRDNDFRAKVVTFCKRLKAENSTSFNKAFQIVVSDELSSKFNYTGVCGKKPFKDLEIVKMLFDAWKGPLIGVKEFVKELTKVLTLGRNRAHNKKLKGINQPD